MLGEGGAHYLRPAGRVSTPPHVIFLDSETVTEAAGALEYEALRCWDASLYHRRGELAAPDAAERAYGTEAAEAAEAIDAWASSVDSCWLYAHNVTFDLVTTGLAAGLCALGWELSARFGMAGASAWLVLHKDGRQVTERRKRGGREYDSTYTKWGHTLTIADSWSVLPKPLAQLAPLTGTIKPPLPAQDDELATWLARCRADVDILAELMLAVMGWWDDTAAGPWSVTGAGLGWQTYRRTLAPRQLVIDHDPALLGFERRGVYGGRRDVFRWGVLPPGRWAEVDFTAAYPTIAAEQPLPAKVACEVSDYHRRLAMTGRVPGGMLAEVTINTPVPRWPVRTPGGIFYPAGRFRTVLAAPDIQAAAEAGALEAVHDGYLYVMTDHLRPWARQVLEWIDPGSDTPLVIKVAAKLWARSTIGKFAQRGWSTQPWVGEPSDGWSITETCDLYTGRRGTVVGLAGHYFLSWADARGEHERPAVLAFVEAHVRSRLGALIAGPYGPAVAQCDTDGMLVELGHLGQLAAALRAGQRAGWAAQASTDDALADMCETAWPLVMREKTHFTQVRMIGPQHVILDGRQRFAGVPGGAWQTGDDTWAARLWPGLGYQAANAPPAKFARPVQGYRVSGPYVNGWILADGSVRAAEARICLHGGTVLLPWRHTRWAAAGERLGGRQSAWAEGMWDMQDAGPERAPAPGGEDGGSVADRLSLLC